VNGQHFQFEHTDILIEFRRFPVASFGRFGRLFPEVRRDAALDLRLYGNAVYFDSQSDGSFVIAEKFGLLDEEENTE
jgi:hypothetical protein